MDRCSQRGPDSFSRRKFLRVAAAGGVAGGMGGCSDSPIAVPEFLQFGPVDETIAPFGAPSGEGIDIVSHCLNRLTFGPSPGEYDRVLAFDSDPEKAADAFVEEQLSPEKIDDTLANRASRGFEYLQHTPGDHYNFSIEGLLEEIIRHSVVRAVKSKRQLHEVMVQFWSDHFNIDSSKGECKWLTASHDRDVIRQHAMGSFPQMLTATATSPAMLWYLDGRVNRKQDKEDKPNENYARELLELHTLGVKGGYTQEDVMESARVLTGWGVKEKGSFWGVGERVFRPDHHDDAEKKVLGQVIPAGQGKEDINRLLDIVALHPSTANYLATKLCRRFISDRPPTAAVEAVAAEFLSSKGDIRRSLRALFKSSAFRESRGNKLKRPFHFVVACLRAIGASTNAREPLLKYLHRMGHAPFHYPTPDGYPEEATPWLSTLLWRWNLAIKFSRNKIEGTKFDPEGFEKNAGGGEGVLRWILGRTALESETAAWTACPKEDRVALLLASPAFQLF
jgi:uncharacterized protein (DUF1800 family)